MLLLFAFSCVLPNTGHTTHAIAIYRLVMDAKGPLEAQEVYLDIKFGCNVNQPSLFMWLTSLQK